jgi:hydrogenase expression/formation protein HypD
VCVTPQGYIDGALEAASRPKATILTYGDMLRVPGQQGSLESLRARGGQVRVCYSILDGLRYAESHPKEEVIFLAVGFETTAPATALAILEAEDKDLQNFTILNSHKRVMPALRSLLSSGDMAIHGFLLPGHVSVIIGSDAYLDLVEKHNMACVVAGFEPHQLLLGLLKLITQVAERVPRLENVYEVAVQNEGNLQAKAHLQKVFEPRDSVWRAMGTLPASGLELREEYARFDARLRFGIETGEDYDPPGCRCGDVIQGKIDPKACPLFGKDCTLEHPIGPCMVSSEGTCAAWYRYAQVKT